MAQNIYDDPEFFAAYSGLRRSQEGLDGAPEWPALRAMLPELRGLRVLDLGCGFGWFCRWARQAGASDVLGLDLSSNMLARAREMTDDPGITYGQANLDTLELKQAAFGLVYSSLALHYVERLGPLMDTIHRALAPGGKLVFSTEHPVMTAPTAPGWAGTQWPVERYLDEGPRRTDWLSPGVLKHHRSIASTVNTLIDAGFTLTRLEEWGPTPEQIADRPALAMERERPAFLLVAATSRPGSRTSC